MWTSPRHLPTVLPAGLRYSNDLADAGLMAVAFAGAIVLLVLLVREPPRTPAGSTEVGHVAELTGEVRHRGPSAVVWQRLSHGDLVHAGDSIFTEAGGGARIELTTHGQLELEPSSLVVLAGVETPVELLRGGLVARAGSEGLRATTAGGIIELPQTGVVHVRRTSGDQAAVEVLSGRARLVTGLGQAVLDEHQAGGFDELGNLAPVEERPFRLVTPERGERLYLDPQVVVQLEWVVEPAAAAVLQLGRQATFDALLIVTPVEATARHYTFEPPGEGVYWWRLVDASGQLQSEARHFTLIRDVPPVPIYPQPGDAVYAPPGHGITFIWSALPTVDTYLFEVAASPSFAPLLYASETSASQLHLEEGWPEGTYHWRVRAAQQRRRSAPFSPAVGFTLFRAPPLGAPELIDEEIRVDAP